MMRNVSSHNTAAAASTAPVMLTPHAEEEKHARSNSTVSAASSAPSLALDRSSADDARHLLSMLPKAIPRIPRNNSGVSLAWTNVDGPRSEPKNTHWRSYDERRYDEAQ